MAVETRVTEDGTTERVLEDGTTGRVLESSTDPLVRSFNNYLFVTVGNGMSTSEKIR